MTPVELDELKTCPGNSPVEAPEPGQFVDIVKKVTGHDCGSCSMCCLLLGIEQLDKAPNTWCQHAKPGKGCAIYAQRPEVCRGYACAWLMTRGMPDYWHPPKSKMVLDFIENKPGRPMLKEQLDAVTGGVAITLRIHIHPAYPQRWREEPYQAEIHALAKAGLTGSGGPFKFRYNTYLCYAGEKRFIVLPHKVLPYSVGITVPLSEDHWEFIACKDEDSTMKLGCLLDFIQQTASSIRARYPHALPRELQKYDYQELERNVDKMEGISK